MLESMLKNERHFACCLFAVTALAGCGGSNLNAPPTPIASTASLNGARLALAVPESPSFTARVPADWKDATAAAFGGVIGAVARASIRDGDGDRMAKEFGVVDPALAVGQGLARRLRMSHRMSEAPATATPAAPTVDAVVAAAPKADMILDVRSQVFGFNYLSKEPTKFFVMNITWARLIDVRSKAVLAEARCIPLKTPPTQMFEQLVGDNGEGIKTGLTAYVDPCIEQLAEKMKL